MKNYFNEKEKSMHLILLLASEISKQFIDLNSPTNAEIDALNGVIKSIDLFTESVFNRLGDGYKRTLKNKASMNTLRLVSRNSTIHTCQMEDTIDADILREIIDKYDIDCENCTDENCTKCTMYKIKSYLGIDGKKEDHNLCPFRKEEKKYDFDFLDEDAKI